MKGPCVTAPSDDTYGGSCASIRMDALLDAMTRVKVDDLAARFHRPRAAVLRQIMHWGLRHGRTTPSDENASPGSVRHLYLNVDAVLQEQVATAAAATGGTIAAWVRQIVCQITLTDFPASWQEAHAEGGPIIPTAMAPASCYAWMHLQSRPAWAAGREVPPSRPASSHPKTPAGSTVPHVRHS
jgi:hypothetical protein